MTPAWSKLQTAYGPATGLDKAIAALGSKSADKRSQALLTLEGCIAHQETIYSASAPAFAAILAHLVSPKTSDRPAIAKLLAKIAWGSGDGKSNAAVAAAVKAAEAQLVGSLGDRDPAVRTALATLIGKLCVLRPAVVDAVVARLAVEDDPAALLALASAPGIVGKATPAWRRACTEMLDAPRTRLAGAVALVSGLAAKAPPAAVAPLVEALRDPAPVAAAWEASPWSNGAIATDLARLLARLGPRRAPELLPPLLDAFDASGDLALARAILGLAAGKRKRGASKPTPLLRDVLLRVLRNDAAWRAGVTTALHESGVPNGRNELAAFLGEPTTLALDLPAGKQKVWERAKVWFKQRKNKSAAALLADLDLAPLDKLRVLDELYEGEHRIHVRWDSEVDLAGAWAAQLAMLAGAAPRIEALIDEPGRSADSSARMLGAFLALGGTLVPAHDRWIPGDHFDRALHPHVPAARLEPRVYDQLCATAKGLGEPDTGHWGIGFAGPAEQAGRFLAVCPTQRLAQLVLGLGGLSGIWGDVEEEVEKHAGNAQVAAALKAFRKRVVRVQSYRAMKDKLGDWVADALSK